MNGRLIKFFFLICFFCNIIPAVAQTTSGLEQRRTDLLEQIQQTNQLLQQNSQTTSAKYSDLKLLQSKSENLGKLIRVLKNELTEINSQIIESQTKITAHEKDIEQLRKSYSESIVTAYKRKTSLNAFVFILSSKSFNSAIQKMNYLKKLNAHRIRQADSIKEKIAALEAEKQKMITQKSEKNTLLAQQTSQASELGETQVKLSAVINDLKEEKGELTALLTQQEAEEQRLRAEIQAVIARELAAQRAREEAARKEAARLAAERESARADETDAATDETTESAEETEVLEEPAFEAAPALASLSNNFSANQGKLPWPLERGVIVSAMGEYGISDLPGIKKDRDGIDIRTNSNSQVKAIFQGQVRSVTTIPGFNKVVIINHGDYFSVYGKLDSVFVSSGDDVSAGQDIGIVDSNNGVSELHLQIWKGQTRLNPKIWLLEK